VAYRSSKTPKTHKIHTIEKQKAKPSATPMPGLRHALQPGCGAWQDSEQSQGCGGS